MSSNSVALDQEKCYVPGDIWQCLKTLLVTIRGVLLASIEQRPGMLLCFYNTQDSPSPHFAEEETEAHVMMPQTVSSTGVQSSCPGSILHSIDFHFLSFELRLRTHFDKFSPSSKNESCTGTLIESCFTSNGKALSCDLHACCRRWLWT